MTIHHVLSTRRTKCYTVCLTLMFLLTCRQLKAQWFLSDLHTFLLPIAPDFNSMMILDWKFFCMSLHVTASVWTVSQPLAMTVEQKWSNIHTLWEPHSITIQQRGQYCGWLSRENLNSCSVCWCQDSQWVHYLPFLLTACDGESQWLYNCLTVDLSIHCWTHCTRCWSLMETALNSCPSGTYTMIKPVLLK